MIYYTDLHCHLGGSTSPDILKSIAYDRGLKILPKSYEEFDRLIRFNEKSNKTDDKILFQQSVQEQKAKIFKEYLDRYKLIQRIASSPAAIMESVYQVVKSAYIDGNVDVLEIKINPMLRNADGIYDLDSIISAACDGIQKAKTIFDKVKCGLIIESDRSFTPKQSLILAKKAIKFKDRGVVGFDISGYQKDFCISDHYQAILESKNGGLGVSLHTNELQTEFDFYNQLIVENTDRIGHGIRICDFGHQLDSILEFNPEIVFEICPNSNINSGVETKKGLRSIVEMLIHKKVRFTVCSDGFVFNGHVKDNYKTLGFSDAEIAANALISKKYSFLK